jgi:beta-glucanase (GH16 family)
MNKIIVSILALLLVSISACNGSITPDPLITDSSSSPTNTPVPTAMATVTPVPTPEWILVWADEFNLPDGSPPDPANWNYSKGGNGWGNSELQNYTDRVENAFIEDGMLVIRAINEKYMGANYSSARLNSMVKTEFLYGRIEARAKLPNTQGIWPAIWMMPTIGRYGNWPASGEIDIMELIGSQPDRTYGTLHFGNPHEFLSASYVFPAGETPFQDFHLYAIEWEPEEIRWYVDDIQYHRVGVDQWFTSMAGAPKGAPFDQPFHLILNVAVGGIWPGNPDETSVFPQEMQIDYIRVFQRP